MITHIEIAASNEVAVGLKTGSVAETIEETGSIASETASMFQRIAGILDTIYHNPTKRTVPAIMQDYAKRGEVLQIKTHQRAQAFNRDHDDTMKPVDYDTEVLSYYPHVIYQASDELDAKKYVRKVHMGEADGQYSRAHAVCVQGLWFVHGRKEAVTA